MDLMTVIDDAFERVGIEVRTGFELRSARRSFDLMLAEWANRGVNRWSITQQTIVLTAGVGEYALGTSTIDIMLAVLRRDGTDYSLERLSQAEWLHIPTKTTQGRPSQFYVDRQIEPILKLWQVPDAADSVVLDKLTHTSGPRDFDGSPSIPLRFDPALVSGLAYYLAIKFSPERVQLLKAIYDEEFLRAAHEDRDRASFRMAPFGGR
jgi:hypothetical protein